MGDTAGLPSDSGVNFGAGSGAGPPSGSASGPPSDSGADSGANFGADVAAHQAQRRAQATLFHLESTLTPQAFLDQIAQETKRGNLQLAALMAGSRTARDLLRRDLLGRGLLQPFTARVLSPDATLYRGQAKPASRRLLVAFTGKLGRLMMPIPLFLQEMDAGSWDVLLLRDPMGLHFQYGCRALAASFPALALRIADLSAGYRGLVAFGTSMGGFAAIRLALHLGGIRAISVGGRPATDTARLLAGQDMAEAFDPICDCLARANRDLLYVCAEGQPLDAAAATLAARQTGGEVMTLPGLRHSVLWQLYRDGLLNEFLKITLEPSEAR